MDAIGFQLLFQDHGSVKTVKTVKTARIDMNELFSKGGKPLIDFLDYCVRSVQMDPLFLFLVQEYRNSPTAAKAVALFEIFFAPGAPGCTTAARVLPLYDARLTEIMRLLRTNWLESQGAGMTAQNVYTPVLLPAKYLFDSVAGELEKRSASLPKIRRRYKPHRTPMENLTGGKMTAAQRHFVERVWQPVIRPRLIAVGFWRIATIA